MRHSGLDTNTVATRTASHTGVQSAPGARRVAAAMAANTASTLGSSSPIKSLTITCGRVGP